MPDNPCPSKDYPYRRKSDNIWDIFAIVGLSIFAIGIVAFLIFQKPVKKERPQPVAPVEFKMPDAEKVGHQVGSSAAGFGKGFYEGIKERTKSKTEESK